MTFTAAIKEAKLRRHEFFTLEHILYAIVHDVTGRRILYHCGADLDKLQSRLEKYFEERSEKLPEGVSQDPIQTLSVQRVLQRALMHVEGAEKKEVDAGDILAAMFYEEFLCGLFPEISGCYAAGCPELHIARNFQGFGCR